MSKWTEIAASILNIENECSEKNYNVIEEKCSSYIEKDGASEDVLAGALMLRAHSRAALGRTESAQEDHERACRLVLGKADGTALLDVASEAMNAHLGAEYCAVLMHNAAEGLDRDGAPARTVAVAYNKEGICRFKAGCPLEEEQKCFENAENAILKVRRRTDYDKMVFALIKSNLAECRARSGDLISAAELYRRAIEIFAVNRAKSATCADEYVNCQRSLSDIYRNQGENVQANICLTHAINALESHPDGGTEPVLAQLASCYNARGTLRYSVSDYEGEIDDCTAALELRRHLPADHIGMATFYSNRGEAYEQTEQFGKAAEDYSCAVDELKMQSDPDIDVREYIAMHLFSKGRCLCEMEDTDGAIRAFTESAAYYRELRELVTDDVRLAHIYDAESLCRFRLSQAAHNDSRRNYHLAMTEMLRAIELLSRLPEDPIVMAKLSVMHSAMGELYELFDEQSCAANEYQIAEALKNRLGDSVADISAEDGEEGDDCGGIWPDAAEDLPKA